jgi:hypothetical protein
METEFSSLKMIQGLKTLFVSERLDELYNQKGYLMSLFYTVSFLTQLG